MQLVEVEDAPAPAPSVRAPDDLPPVAGEPPAVGRTRPMRRWWPVALLVVLGVVATGLVAAARDRAFVQRVAAVPGMVRPLDEPPTALWQTRSSTLPGTVLAADGALVVLAEGETEWAVTAHDPQTGTERWRTAVAPVSRAGFEATAVTCPALRGDVGDLVVCLVQGPRVLYSDEASIQEPPRISVVPLSATDGTRLGEWDVRGAIVGVDRVGDDLVVGTLDEGRHLVVQRRDARTGALVWSTVTQEVMDEPANMVTATMQVLPSVVVLAGGSTLILDVDDGSTLLVSGRYSAMQVASLGDRFATWAPVGGGHVHRADGAEQYRVDGLPAQLSADDGSEPDTIVVDAGPAVAGVDAGTGQELWRTESMLDPQVLVSHRLVVSGSSTYGVLDTADGTLVWDVDTGEVLPWNPLSDGTVVLGPGMSPEGRPELWARGLGDGVRYWSVSLPEGVRRVDAVAGHLVVRTDDELIVYG
jgi:outer membrane protein assembly factor BamB